MWFPLAHHAKILKLLIFYLSADVLWRPCFALMRDKWSGAYFAAFICLVVAYTAAAWSSNSAFVPHKNHEQRQSGAPAHRLLSSSTSSPAIGHCHRKSHVHVGSKQAAAIVSREITDALTFPRQAPYHDPRGFPTANDIGLSTGRGAPGQLRAVLARLFRLS